MLDERGVRSGQGARNDRTSDTVSEVAAELGVINRAMRRIGQLLAETPKESGGDKYSTREDLSSPVQSTRNKTGYKLSAKSQQLAP
jgi:hypothetical protein